MTKMKMHTIITKCPVCGKSKRFVAAAKSRRKTKALAEAVLNMRCDWCERKKEQQECKK